LKEITVPSRELEPDRQTMSIVVLGDFNPSIFQPQWFAVNDLMPREEADAADVNYIGKEFASFTIGSIYVQVDDSRLGLNAVESSRSPLLRDLAVGTLSTLDHTPLRAIGLNLDSQFTMDSEEAWNGVGDMLVPKEKWLRFLDHPGMRQVVVEGLRSDCSADRNHIRVQPTSVRGVMVSINQHYQLETLTRTEVQERNKEALRALGEDWTSFLDYANSAARGVLETSR